MSRSFTKLFSSITESTVWGEPYHVRIVWVTMLAMADRCGRVFGAIPGLARRACVTLEETEDALDRFQKPDQYSRSSDNEGRRIEPIEGGWRLLNYLKYRAVQDVADKRESDAERQRRHYHRSTGNTHDSSRGLTQPHEPHRESRDLAQAEADTDKEKELEDAPRPAAEYSQDFEAGWSALPKREGGNPKRAAYGCWKARLSDGHTAAEMIEGSRRYASWCRATGKTGTETVMQGKRFFGREKEFLLPWAVGGAKPEPTAEERAAAALRNRAQLAWGEVSTAVKLGAPVRGADAQITLAAVERIGGLDTLKRLPPRELQDKGASFAREFSALSRAA